jgi:hypothetical protein
MSSSKKIDLKRDFAAGVYLSEAQNPIPPPHTHCTCIQYTYSHRERERGGRVELERRGERQHFTKLGRKYHHD